MNRHRQMVKRIAMMGGAALAVPWYLSGGIASANCLAAYKGKGASSLASSYVNLANPSTYDITTLSAPTLAAGGWNFDHDAHYLVSTGLPWANTSTVIVRFTDCSSDYTADRIVCYGLGGLSLIRGASGSAVHYYFNGNWDSVAGRLTAGTVAIANDEAYLDGVTEGAITASAAGGANIFWGASDAGGTSNVQGTIAAMAVYDIALTTAQVLALHTSMVAL